MSRLYEEVLSHGCPDSHKDSHGGPLSEYGERGYPCDSSGKICEARYDSWRDAKLGDYNG